MPVQVVERFVKVLFEEFKQHHKWLAKADSMFCFLHRVTAFVCGVLFGFGALSAG